MSSHISHCISLTISSFVHQYPLVHHSDTLHIIPPLSDLNHSYTLLPEPLLYISHYPLSMLIFPFTLLQTYALSLSFPLITHYFTLKVCSSTPLLLYLSYLYQLCIPSMARYLNLSPSINISSIHLQLSSQKLPS